VIHHGGKQTMRAIGPKSEDKARADSIAEKVNARITLEPIRAR
jgi:hypothetical protein